MGKPGMHRLERVGSRLFAWRNWLFTLLLVGLLGVLRPLPLRGNSSADRWLDAAGLILALMGQGLRGVVVGYAPIKPGGKKGRVGADRLITDGMFDHVRNPLYLGNLLVLTGLFVMHNNPWGYLVGLPGFLFAYAAIVVAEEAYLRGRFGAEYQEYCRRVPRWLPRLRGLRQSLAGKPFDGRRMVRTEYGSAFAWVAGALVILAHKLLVGPPFPERTACLAGLGALFALATAVWAGARSWKMGNGHVSGSPPHAPSLPAKRTFPDAIP
jgi:protein-S-isoprenylcysteine O-methyltransferase Ste14